MNRYVALAVILIAALLQTSAMPALVPRRLTPDLILALTVSWGLLSDRRESIILALGGGVALDMLSGGPLGANTVALLAVAAIATTPALATFRGSPWLPGAVAVATTTVHELMYATALVLVGRTGVASSVVQVLIRLIVLNALAVYALYYALGALQSRSRLGRLTGRP
jgi:rod shape-determining protein MreD